MVEQLTVNQLVAGSNPARGATLLKRDASLEIWACTAGTVCLTVATHSGIVAEW